MPLRHLGFRQLCHARDLLRQAPVEPSPTVADIAAAVGLSTAHFSRQFEALFGLPPHQYRLQARLELARRLLAAGDHSVTEVCFAVGASSLGSFSTWFAGRMGEAPSDYRRRVRMLVSLTPSRPQLVLQPGCLNLFAQLPASSRFREAPHP